MSEKTIFQIAKDELREEYSNKLTEYKNELERIDIEIEKRSLDNHLKTSFAFPSMKDVEEFGISLKVKEADDLYIRKDKLNSVIQYCEKYLKKLELQNN